MTATKNQITNQRFWNIVDGFVHEVIDKDAVVFHSLIDISRTEDFRRKEQQDSGVKPSYTALVIKAVSMALAEYPEVNCMVIRNRRIPLEKVNAVIAVEREVPDLGQIVLSAYMDDTDKMSAVEISEKLREFGTIEIEKVPLWNDFLTLIRKVPGPVARFLLKLPTYSPTLWRKWRGGSFVVTSPAKYGVDSVSAVWHYPLTIAFGLIKERPVVVDGQVVARSTLPFTLAWDRRLMPGAPAARFFNAIVTRLEKADFGEPKHQED
ncbi:2-oxo acid dehydrogenase subunit E2 [Geoalkalibacter halelectricus]|uniref:2-oxo acid dehydrogenase subunit E2 n=1 Tax=Geoalkalibacter halelectricus TaxID=2847045 RepID=A0ABY5ZHB6_9BACT|nr:2-oxo acid dehydrogenase subunit E2 [Geoalkalibacter halelectricus]MDO3379689.1 2-oxo acid dehydrogenase subunit E2 [Geoalkalibacter halelectricus]UWZ78496.1 2-oxo acid dehydrogenase subunit E2 [Geoalkalibacter halelectricus]